MVQDPIDEKGLEIWTDSSLEIYSTRRPPSICRAMAQCVPTFPYKDIRTLLGSLWERCMVSLECMCVQCMWGGMGDNPI